jgi:hypothetical protein
MSSMTIKALLPSPRHTCHDATLTALKMQFVRRLQMLCTALYIASWQVRLGDGSNALIVMEDISKTLY